MTFFVPQIIVEWIIRAMIVNLIDSLGLAKSIDHHWYIANQTEVGCATSALRRLPPSRTKTLTK